MLTPATRTTFHTLLDARAFAEPNDAPAIIFVATEAEPVVVTRRALATAVTLDPRRLDVASTKGTLTE